MPKGNPGRQTIATDKYQKKAGYKVKSFKLKGTIAEEFDESCRRAGMSQAAVITELMKLWVDGKIKLDE